MKLDNFKKMIDNITNGRIIGDNEIFKNYNHIVDLIKDGAIYPYDVPEQYLTQEIICTFLNFCGTYIADMPKIIQNNRKYALLAVSKDGNALEFLNDDFRKDPKIAMVAIRQNGASIRYAHKEIRGDHDIAIEAVSQTGIAFNSLTKDLRNNAELLKIALKTLDSIRRASDELKKNSEIIGLALQKDGMNIQYASEEYKSNQKFGLMAVNSNGLSIQYLSDCLKDNYEIMNAAFHNNPSSIIYSKLRRNRALVKQALKNDGRIFCNLEEYHNDEEIVKKVLKTFGGCVRYIGLECLAKEEIAKIAANSNLSTGVAKYLAPFHNNNKEIMKILISRDSDAFQYVSTELKDDIEMVKIAITTNMQNYNLASPRLQHDPELIVFILSKEISNFNKLPISVTENESIMTKVAYYMASDIYTCF